MNILRLVKNKLICERDKAIRAYNKLINIKLATKKYGTPTVKSIDETLDKLMQGNVSMVRFGDGEYKVMAGDENGFQKPDPVLSERLREIVKLNGIHDDFLVCIPNIPNGLDLLADEARRFWYFFITEHGLSWYGMLNFKSEYYNAHVTRLYYDWKSKEKCAEWFSKIKKIWDGRDIVIIEGEKGRLGIGNDLFENAVSVKRILAPSNSAFSKYDEILAEAKKVSKDTLILIALGQTATVLAYDLYREGYHALDIGHIDIEYEWFLKQATEKVAVVGKYVKEVQDLDEVSESDKDLDAQYLSQIIAKIG